MSSDSDSSPRIDLERQRVPLERKISLKFKEFRGFITEYSANLSLGGMFIRTTSPKPPGTIFDFELSLTDDFKLVQGIGEVVWSRETDGGPDRPPGMGVRFLDLSPESRKLIERIVEEHVQHGGVPFELESPSFPPPARPVAPSPAAPPARPPGAAAPVFHATAAPMSVPPPRPAPVAPPAERPAPEPVPAKPSAPPAQPWNTPPAPGGAPRAVRQPAIPFVEPEPPAGEPPTSGDEQPAEGEAFPDLDFAELDALEDEGPLGAVAPPPAEPPAERTELLPKVGWEDGADEGSPAFPAAPAGGAARATAPPSGTAQRPGAGPSLPAGFDEVARAFAADEAPPPRPPAAAAEMRSPFQPAEPLTGGPHSIVDDETVRMVRSEGDRGLEPLTASGGLAESQAPRGSVAAPYPLPERRQPARRRRSLALPLAATALLLLAGAGTAVWFAFPQLIPAWLPHPEPPATAGAPVNRGGLVRPLDLPGQEPAGGEDELADAAGAPATDPAAALSGAPTTQAGGARSAPPQGDSPRPDEVVSRPFANVTEIWGRHTPAGTVVTLVADGLVPDGAYSTFRLDGGNPREVLRLRGVASGFERSTVPIGTAEVKQVRVGFHEKPSGNELHVVMDLTSSRVHLVRVVPADNRLEILLAPQ